MAAVTHADVDAARRAAQHCKCKQAVCPHVREYERLLNLWLEAAGLA